MWKPKARITMKVARIEVGIADHDDDGVAPSVQEEQHDDRGQDDAFDQRLPDADERLLRVVGRRVDLRELELRELRLDRLRAGRARLPST